MPDWREIVRDRLTPLRVGEKRQEDIVAELAGHLDDLYEDLVRQGRSEVEAVRFASSSVADWAELRREIQLAANEGVIMNHRVKALWLPGVWTSALSMLLLRLFQIPWAPAPYVFWLRNGMALVIYWRWLLCLPVIGAIGAYLSRHAGGKLVQRLLAVSFPVLGMISLLALMSPFVLVYDLARYHRSELLPIAILLLGWGVLPEAALLLGALPFLRGDAAESGQVAASQ
jgi:hypothetical protein